MKYHRDLKTPHRTVNGIGPRQCYRPGTYGSKKQKALEYLLSIAPPPSHSLLPSAAASPSCIGTSLGPRVPDAHPVCRFLKINLHLRSSQSTCYIAIGIRSISSLSAVYTKWLCPDFFEVLPDSCRSYLQRPFGYEGPNSSGHETRVGRECGLFFYRTVLLPLSPTLPIGKEGEKPVILPRVLWLISLRNSLTDPYVQGNQISNITHGQ